MKSPTLWVALLITGTLTVLQFFIPGLLEILERSPATYLENEWWRLLTPVFINRGGWVEISFNLLSLLLVGAAAAKIFGVRQWLIFYLSGGVVGEIAGLAWKPVGAGNSVAVCGLLGALSVVWIFQRKTRPAFAAGAIVLLCGLGLTFSHNLHGPPLIAGAALSYFLLGL